MKRYENSGKNWSIDEENQLIQNIEMYNDKNRIAEIHGRSMKAINMRLAMIMTRCLKQGDTKANVAHKFKMTESEMDTFVNENINKKHDDNPKNDIPNNDQVMKKLDRIETLLLKIYRHNKKEKNKS